MKSLKRCLAIVAVISGLLSSALFAPKEASAVPFRQGYLTLSPGRKVFYRHFPGHPSRPTLVLVNGLVQPMEFWSEFSIRAQARGYTVVQFAFSAQPESLSGIPRNVEPDFLRRGLDLEDLSEEILAVTRAFGRGGRVELVAFSYGSVAVEFARRHRELVDKLVLVSPLLEPIRQYDPEGKLFPFYLDAWKAATNLPGYGEASRFWYDVTWNVIHGRFMRARDPNYVPAGVDPVLFKKGVFHLLRAARDFNLRDYANEALPPVHLLAASSEFREELLGQLAAWESLSLRNRGTLTYFDGADRALPEAHPAETLAWLERILGVGGASGADRNAYVVSLLTREASRWSYPRLKKAIELSTRR